MPVTNQQIADALLSIADALTEQEENPYKIRAYRRAALSVKKYPDEIFTLVVANIDLTIIPGVGKKLAYVIMQMVTTENLTWTPEPRPAQFYSEKLLTKRKLKSLKIYSVMNTIEKILERLRKISLIDRVEVTGEYRRKKEVINQIKIIFVSQNINAVFDEFYTFPSIKYIIERNEFKTTVQLKIGIDVVLEAASEKTFATKVFYETGTTEHLEKIEKKAAQKKLKLSSINFRQESEIYENLSLPYIEPELRENRGELEAAEKNNLPNLIKLSDIKGDLHCHTHETDGYFSLEEMVAKAYEQGYEYVAITDHSKSLKITNGMDEKRLLNQIKQIDKLNERYSQFNFTILKSMEIDILEDGSLDLDESVLKELDITVCSVHSKFRLPIEKQTDRIIRAMDNPYFNILGHATGRLINHRRPYDVDMFSILTAAKERNCIIEINAQPARLDINDIYCKQAKELGVKVAISSDAHTLKGFEFMILGVNQARRGWLEAKDVINSYHLSELRKIIKR